MMVMSGGRTPSNPRSPLWFATSVETSMRGLRQHSHRFLKPFVSAFTEKTERGRSNRSRRLGPHPCRGCPMSRPL